MTRIALGGTAELFFMHIKVKMDESVADYRHAFGGPIADGSVPIQSEEFIQIVLANEPNLIQLHFCLGLINYHAKSDYASAASDFREFLAKLKEDGFPRQAVVARELLADCAAKIKGVKPTD